MYWQYVEWETFKSLPQEAYAGQANTCHSECHIQ
jgi:hypothetical protein